MQELIKTIVSKDFTAFYIIEEGGFDCCIMPRYDSNFLALAIQECINKNQSVSIQTNTVSVDIVKLNKFSIIDFKTIGQKENFQIKIVDLKMLAISLNIISLKGLKLFGRALQINKPWYFSKILRYSA
jgi:hypothetical protein